MKNAIVIGAGIGGLATAALLAKQGLNVTILEKNSQIGGRARTYSKKGFIFDMGPSWYMMPDTFDKFFKQFNKKTNDFYTLKRLKTNYKVFFDDKSTIKIKSNIKNNIETFENLEKNAGKNLTKYLKNAKELYDLSMKNLILTAYKRPTELLKPELIQNIFKFNLQEIFHTKVKKFFKSKKLQNTIEFPTVFLGGSPYNTPSFYSLMNYIDCGLGVWYPNKGIAQIPKALEKLCQEYNVKIKKNESVDEIITKNNKIIKVKTKKNSYQADFFIANADYAHIEQMLPKKLQTYSQKYWQKTIKSPTAIITYIATKKKIKNIDHHNLFLTNNIEDEFKSAYKKTTLPKLSSYYVHCPSKTDKTISPKGKDALMFLIPLSSDIKFNEEKINSLVSNTINHFEEKTNTNLKDNIEFKKLFTKKDFIKDYNSLNGSAFGIAHTLFQTGPFRPKNKSKKIKNLFYSGQNTNPGIGVPMTLISAQITNELIKNEI